MVEPLALLIDRLDTPIGELLIVADRAGKLRTIDWTDHEARMRQLLDRYYGKGGYTLESARDPGGLTRAMRAYFKGDIGVIDRLPVETTGTPFQKSVWRALRKIGSGTDDQLCRAGAAHRQAQGGARRGPRQRPEPDQHRRALPSRDRLGRHADRLWRRAAAQEMAAGARGRARGPPDRLAVGGASTT